MRGWRRCLPLLAVAAPYAIQISCDSPDAAPTLRLSDAAQGGCAGSETLAVPIALGARLAVQVAAGGAEVTVNRAESSDPTVLTVEATDNPVLLRAAAAGSSNLRVWSATQGSVSAALTVEEVSSVAIGFDDLVLFNLDVNQETSFTTTAAGLVEGGVALLPDGVVRVVPTFIGADGAALSGHDLASWTASPAALSWTYPLPYSDTIEVMTNGSTQGVVTLRDGTGSALTLTLHPSGAAASMAAYWPETGALSSKVSLAVGEVRTVVGVVQDTGGLLLLGDDGAPLRVEPAGENIRVVPPPWSQGEDGVEATPDLEALLSRVRAAWIEGVHPGATELVISAAGVSQTIAVTITE
jgi:hypothetical protein